MLNRTITLLNGMNRQMCRAFNRAVKCALGILVSGAGLIGAVIDMPAWGQAPSSPSAQGAPAAAGGTTQQGAAAATGSTQQPGASPAQSPGAKKPKKVWTNDDVASSHDPETGAPRNVKDSPKKAVTAKPSVQSVANIRKQLEKLEEQLKDTDQQISDLKDFLAGKPAPAPGGYQLGKGYNRVPVDQQIAKLEDKKKQLQAKIGDLLDEARKNGIEPGQLR